jgi:hypothetical protein
MDRPPWLSKADILTPMPDCVDQLFSFVRLRGTWRQKEDIEKLCKSRALVEIDPRGDDFEYVQGILDHEAVDGWTRVKDSQGVEFYIPKEDIEEDLANG